MTNWRYDSASRTVYDTTTGDAVCIVSDLAEVAEMHRIGRCIAASATIIETIRRLIASEETP